VVSAFQLDTGMVTILLLFGGPVAVAIAHYIYKYARMRAEMDLKQTLAEQGYSPDEIERILRMRSGEK